MEFGGGDFLKHFLEGSVDLIIYRDYIVNRCFFIYCSLATGDIKSLKLRRNFFIFEADAPDFYAAR